MRLSHWTQQQRRWCAGRDPSRYRGDDVGEHERAEGYERDGQRGRSVRHGVEFAGEEIPQARPRMTPSGTRPRPDLNRNGRLPSTTAAS